MFDLKNDKWFIRVETEQQCLAVQEWAFEQGLSWAGCQTLRGDFRSWDKPCAIGHGHFGGSSLGQARIQYWIDNGHHQIDVSFKTTVDKVNLPEVESKQQKQIRELEATVAEAQRQIQELKKDI